MIASLLSCAYPPKGDINGARAVTTYIVPDKWTGEDNRPVLRLFYY